MNELKKYLWQKKMMKIKYILICILGFDRVKYLKYIMFLLSWGIMSYISRLNFQMNQSLLKYIIM